MKTLATTADSFGRIVGKPWICRIPELRKKRRFWEIRIRELGWGEEDLCGIVLPAFGRSSYFAQAQ